MPGFVPTVRAASANNCSPTWRSSDICCTSPPTAHRRAGTRDAVGKRVGVGGVIKHVVRTRRWIDIVQQRQKPFTVDVGHYTEGFRLVPDESLRDVPDFSGDVARETDSVVRGPLARPSRAGAA